MQGLLLRRLRRFDEAVRSARRALQLNPNFALAHAWLGLLLYFQGAHQEAIESAERALRLQLLSGRSVATYASQAMAMVHFAGGRYPECLTWARNLIEKSPGHLVG